MEKHGELGKKWKNKGNSLFDFHVTKLEHKSYNIIPTNSTFMNNLKLIRSAGWVGIIAQIFSFFAIFASIRLCGAGCGNPIPPPFNEQNEWASDGSFSWRSNALSDIGISKVALIFNSSLFLLGILTLVFFIGFLKAYAKSALFYLGGILLMLASVLVSLLGVFTEAYATAHIIFAFATFALGAIGVLVIGIAFIRMKMKTKGYFSILAGIISLLVMLIPWHHWIGLGVAVPQIVVSVVSGVWIVYMSVSLPRYGRASSELTPAELAQCAKLLMKGKLLEDRAVLVEYWKKVKETIHLFDEIIVKYVIQWAAILLAIVGGSALVFGNSTPEIDFSLLAGIVALSATLISIPIAIKCWFYYQLLEEALRVAEDIEEVMFNNDEDTNLAKKLGLTLRLTKISTKQVLGIKFFGWTILAPFAFLFAISLLLMLYYFCEAFGWELFGAL